MFIGRFEFGQLVKLMGLTIDTKTHITLRLHLGKQPDKFALALTLHRRKEHQFGLSRQSHQQLMRCGASACVKSELMLDSFTGLPSAAAGATCLPSMVKVLLRRKTGHQNPIEFFRYPQVIRRCNRS